MSGLLAPLIRQRFFDDNGAPLAGGKLYAYLAGTSTPTPTYSDEGLTTPNTNPIILDANGRCGAIYLSRAIAYKFVLTDANDVTVGAEGGDNVSLPPDVAPPVANSVPTGAILRFPDTAAPTGYLACDGSAVSRTAYAALFALIGTTFGSGDGATTFNLPNLQQPVTASVGTWTTGVVDPASFTANGSMTWTVEIGDVTTYAYELTGKTMRVAWTIANTAVGGTPSTTLQILIPASKTASRTISTPFKYFLEGGTEWLDGTARVSATATVIELLTAARGNWPAGGVSAEGEITFEVTAATDNGIWVIKT